MEGKIARLFSRRFLTDPDACVIEPTLRHASASAIDPRSACRAEQRGEERSGAERTREEEAVEEEAYVTPREDTHRYTLLV